MTRYAENTTVPVDRSRMEIEKCLERHGARGFYYGSEGGRAMVGFKMLNERGNLLAVRMQLDLPDQGGEEFALTPTGKKRDRNAAMVAWEQACRSRWRALLLIVKAKLEAVDIGITTIEREFMPDLLMPNGMTLGQMVAEQRPALEAGGALKLLPGGSR